MIAKLIDSRKRIERAYQRAMNIRDSIQSSMTDEGYAAAYRYAYRLGEVSGFRMATRKYLRDLRSAALKAGKHD